MADLSKIKVGGTTYNIKDVDARADITELSSQIVALQNKKYIFIADSYGHASGTNNGWIDKLVTLLGLEEGYYYESGIGGAGFTKTGTTKFLNMITSLASTITDKTSITDIVVCGGANDTGVAESEISDAVKAFVNYCHSTFPKALVSVGMIAGTTNVNNIGTQYSRTCRAYANCGRARFLQNLQYVFHDYSLIGSDSIHPTAEGYTVLSEKIYQAISGGTSVHYYEAGNVSFDNGYSAITGVGQPTFNVSVDNGETVLSFPYITGKQADDSAHYFGITAGHLVRICNVESKYIKGVSSTSQNWRFGDVNAFAIVHSTVNNNYYSLPGRVCFMDGTLFFSTNDNQLGQTSAFTSCDNIRVYPLTMTFPTLMC